MGSEAREKLRSSLSRAGVISDQYINKTDESCVVLGLMHKCIVALARHDRRRDGGKNKN